MSVYPSGSATGGTTTYGEEPEITKRADGTYACVIGEGNNAVTVVGKSPEEIENWIAWVSDNKQIPFSEMERAHFTSSMVIGGYDNLKNGENEIRLNATGKDYIKNYSSTEHGGVTAGNSYYGVAPRYTPGSEAYINSEYNPDARKGSAQNTDLAGLSGAANHLYNSNYSEDSSKLLNMGNQDTGTVKLLELMFGPGTVFTENHLNILRLMGLIEGNTAKGSGAGAQTPSAKGQGVIASSEDESRVQDSAYIPTMSLLGISQDGEPTQGLGIDLAGRADGVATYFENGALKPGYSTQTIEDDAKAINAGMTPVAGEELPLVTYYDPKSKEMMNHLFAKDPTNETFTTEEINTAVAMGLVTYHPDSQVFNTTHNGNAYSAAKQAAPPVDAAPPTAPTGNYGTPEEYNAYVDSLGIPTVGDNGNFEGDKYSNRGKLLSRGFPPEVVEWIFSRFADEDGMVSEITLDALIEKGFLTHVNRDKHGKGEDRYALTPAGVELIAADPSLFTDPEARKQFFITAIGIATYAADVVSGKVKISEKAFFGNAVAYANEAGIRAGFEDEWADFVANPLK